MCVGPKDCYSAYRAELAGLYGGLLRLRLLCDYKNITHGQIIIGYNGLGKISKIQWKPLLPAKHFVYLSALHNLILDISVSVRFVHVARHMDKVSNIENLSVI